MEYAGMSAVEALRVARAAGVAVMIDGEGLLLRADAEPPRAVLDALSRQKSAIISLPAVLMMAGQSRTGRASSMKYSACLVRARISRRALTLSTCSPNLARTLFRRPHARNGAGLSRL